MATIGDRVLAFWPGEADWWYPGVIVSEAAGTYDVQFDDGDRSNLREDQVRPLAFAPGARVYCRWKGGPSYYGGTVDQTVQSALHIQYDDGDQEWSSVSMIRVHRTDIA